MAGVVQAVAVAIIAASVLAIVYLQGAKAGMRSMRPSQDHLLDEVRRLQDEKLELLDTIEGIRHDPDRC